MGNFLTSTLKYAAKREVYNQTSKFIRSKNPAEEKLTRVFKVLLLIFCGMGALINLSSQKNFGLAFCIFLIPFASLKVLSILNKLLFVRSTPVYDEVPVYKTDRRYKTGAKISHYKLKRVSKDPFTAQELSDHLRKYTLRLIAWSSLIGILIYSSY
ncbi:MAG: hypothetical protein K0S09_64 [Sphingobacteriaceae bacterium]|jgi:hypothetical protein|nr:hypothetical protein [Sphingobacteriaceae bacterium]